jgi:hypothetical protein
MTTSFGSFQNKSYIIKMEPSTSSLKFVAVLSTAKKSPSTDTTDSNS